MLMTLFPLLLPAPASAAEPTDFPPPLRGDVSIGYTTAYQYDDLEEDGDDVGRRQLMNNRLELAGAFSFYKGLALFVEAPRYATSVRFSESHEMAFDPTADGGTMAGTGGLDDSELTGKGFGGPWIGLRGAPFHEQLFATRGDRSSWVLEAGYRFPDQSSLWTTDDAGERGAGPGAPGFRFRGAFSTTHRWAEPYLTIDLERAGRISGDLRDESGAVVATAAEFHPASAADFGTGVEVMVWQDSGEGTTGLPSQVTLDFHARFGYESWQQIPSGLYLPSVLDASRSVVVTQSEVTYLMGGFGVNSRILEYGQVNIGAEVGTVSPQLIEHLYEVSTGPGTIAWQLTTELRFRVRDPIFGEM